MRDNFRPNVRLTTNILMVIGTFLIAFNLSSVNKQSKTPSPANAETWHLMAFHWISGAPAGVSQVSWTIPFNNEADCEEAGKKFMSKNWLPEQRYNKQPTDYLCVKGK